ncbi:MAG: glycosyltransferase [Nostoc sp. NMS7]|uniref:glycosyltransferase n=1 Tax=Nostoc sp. NMS7 TaxID=2815391 RepID=UPI0025E6726B|nr:glycosyltransferase [Nostoc sp. NMS7]MBN3951472.1 glycosyltransferase [Nostoc sp. NMS7]
MISVITPVYNGDKFIESCLQNVINQNFAEVEHIIVDGGSTDKRIDIIKDYANQHPHIHWISEKDQGQSDAMNKGISMAQGIDFINRFPIYSYFQVNRPCDRGTALFIGVNLS